MFAGNSIPYGLRQLQKALQPYGASQIVPENYAPSAEDFTPIGWPKRLITPEVRSSSSKSVQLNPQDKPADDCGTFKAFLDRIRSSSGEPSGTSFGSSASGGCDESDVCDRVDTVRWTRSRGGSNEAAVPIHGIYSGFFPYSHHLSSSSGGVGPSGRDGPLHDQEVGLEEEMPDVPEPSSQSAERRE
jgi:hypothetical protein